MSAPVVVLAGGTGGAKLARGMLDLVGEDLVVLANTGDDIEIYGAYVSPDPDLVTFWLADLIDERGWGLRGDTFEVMQGLREIGVDVWFNLGDRDLAIGIERQRALRQGSRLTDAQQAIAQALGVGARVLPMSETPVRTHVMARGRWWAFQEYMIRAGAPGPVQDVAFRAAKGARTTPEVLEAIRHARAIVIGPSNPIISIGPILAISEIREAVMAASAPVVAVSPLVGGEVVKGPTSLFMQWAGFPLNAEGISQAYAGLIDGLVSDEPAEGVPVLQTSVLMDSAEARRALAGRALEFALSLTG